MRKIPKYRPIKQQKTRVDRRDIALGFMAVILILSLMAGGAIALVMTGVFTPVVLTNPLVEQPSDELNIPPQPTMKPAAGAVWVGGGVSLQAVGTSGKKSGLSDEQRKELEQQNANENFDAYAAIEDPWDVESVLNAVIDLELPPIPDDARITVRKDDLNPNSALPDEWTNILLLGTDDRDAQSNTGRTDTIIIASINQATGQIKLTSLARDMFVEVPNLADKQRLNVAHAYGGPNLTMKAINTVFDMNITKYVRVNLHGLVDILSFFGGAWIELIPGEAEQINYNVAVAEDYEGFEKNPDRALLKKDQVGLTKLDPLQAMGYARIRHIDSDLARTNRQRVLLEKLMEMAMEDADPQRLFLLANVIMPYTTTNLPLSEIVKTAVNMLVSGLKPMEFLSIPLEGSYSYVHADAGEAVLDANITLNKTALHEFIYGQYIARPTK
ncbi:MAG: LCP family protein [Oscillospiraceae bacterium]|jgi:LCP family protein required for cell wall assembly|nr:LCP family protein [Oscillospiraceae bacterium]